ncbi:hypothetical protein SFRA_31345 [Streptomyces sp. F-3]|jgi:hypothetical protein|uniref:Integral membrane protein n=1 Tax=Streptomyces thermogriseus TaxID=75292 RepID=A0ABN1T2U4_9ACTN|nr:MULTISPECIES: hypothetical protein [Streptomyces]MDN5381855.1 hypothetical protein [Streptomyces sp. LB8]GAT80014.1 hypothetical protein SFRA_31345 [Streptomyces sp. F-3]
MRGEAIFVVLYSVALLGVVGLLEFYARQPTSAWASQVFAGYRRAVPDAPRPAGPDEWPHSEVGRFHRALSLFVAVIAVLLVSAELVRHHRPLETLALVAVGAPHAVVVHRLQRRLRRRTAPANGADHGPGGEGGAH